MRPLDREQRARYVLEAAASDRGSPSRNTTAQIVIDVTDVNDHQPQFNQSEYTAVISEQTQVSMSVHGLQYRPPTGQALTPGPPTLLDGVSHG